MYLKGISDLSCSAGKTAHDSPGKILRPGVISNSETSIYI
jgi:hypothetical protein